MSKVILCLNSGSSSRKFALYAIGTADEKLVAEGEADRVGLAGGRLRVRGADGTILLDEANDFEDASAATAAILDAIADLKLPEPDAAGHRIVHGGPDHAAPELIMPDLKKTLEGLAGFAPLHIPAAIQVIDAVAARFPMLPQVACFDTSFHHSMPEVAQRFALPEWLWEEGVRRYGFHGISYEYIMQALGEPPPGRLIIAHLGNGASMVAVRDGRPIDTTMGFTPTGGFMMGTRPGDLDPGVELYLIREKRLDPEQLDRLINQESGLRGVSGISPDMRTLFDERDRSAAARRAIEMFCYQVRKHIGALAAALGGIDLLVLTGGIGENAAPIRWEICSGLEHLGIRLDRSRNDAQVDTISASDSPCAVRVIPTNEDLMIARHTKRLLFG